MLCGIFALYELSNNDIKKIIDKQQTVIYTEKIDTILQMLENRYSKLEKTLLVESYEHIFKESAINEIKKISNIKNTLVSPFIINEKNFFILHPILNKNNYKSYSNSKAYKRIINSKDANFYIKYKNQNKWIIFKHFKKWNWIVGYTMPVSFKYYDLKMFTNKVNQLS